MPCTWAGYGMLAVDAIGGAPGAEPGGISKGKKHVD